jgi:hypothetical protein
MSSSLVPCDGGTIPGQSIKYIRFIKVTYCQTFVSPGMGATVATFFFLSVLIMDDFPVFGYPIRPTEICLRAECSVENCRNNVIKEPFPKEFVIDA